MARTIPIGKLQKIWAVIWGDAIFLLFQVSLADVDMLYSDSFSRNVTFNCLMFMPEISNLMVFVNGKHPRIFHLATKNFGLFFTAKEKFYWHFSATTLFHMATEKKISVASWRLPKKVNFGPWEGELARMSQSLKCRAWLKPQAFSSCTSCQSRSANHGIVEVKHIWILC